MPPKVTSSGIGRPTAYVCRACVWHRQPLTSQWRTFSATLGVRSSPGSQHITVPGIRGPAVNSPPPSAPPSVGIAQLTSRRLISVSGPDAAKHLHGLMTRNVQNGTPRSSGFYGAFLSAKGRVLHDVFVYPHNTHGAEKDNAKPEESFLIDVDAAQAKVLWSHLRRYKLRLKVHLRLLDPNEAVVWQAWANQESPGSAAALGDGPKATAVDELALSVVRAQEAGISILQDTRAPGMGYRFVTPGGQDGPPPIFQLPTTHPSAYLLRRYLRGVPEGQTEIPYEQALPFESNLDLMGGIDFHKGCYIGQELTIRTKHRGVVRKRTLPCIAYSPDDVAPQTLEYSPGVGVTEPGNVEVEQYDTSNIPQDTSIERQGKTGRAAGKWMHGVGNIGLALCRLEVMTDVTIPGLPEVTTRNPGDAFLIRSLEDLGGAIGAGEASQTDDEPKRKGSDKLPYIGPMLNIKAFIPDWVRKGLAGEPSK